MNSTVGAERGLPEITEELRQKDPELFDKAFGLSKIVAWWLQDRAEIDLDKARILDFGCGFGEAALGFALKHPGARVFGIDIDSQTSEATLRQRFKNVLPDLDFPSNLRIERIQPGDVPTFGKKFDAIYSWSVVEHIKLDILDEVLRDIRTALDDDGYFFVQVDPLYYSAFGHHVAWNSEFAWSHLTRQGNEFQDLTDNFSGNAERSRELTACYDGLNRLTAEELKDRLEAAGFFVEAQFRSTVTENLPDRLRYAYRDDVIETSQVVLLCRKAAVPSCKKPLPRLNPGEFQTATKDMHMPFIEQMGDWWSDLPGIDLGIGRNLFEASEQAYRCIELLGSIHDFTVFEVGPRDGYYTYALEKAGANVLATEFNWENYLRCLHVKNQFDLKAKFIFGDAENVLDCIDAKFDLMYLSGVVYHFKDPVNLLNKMLAKTDRAFVWTHVHDAELIAANQTIRGEGKRLADMHVGPTRHRIDGEDYTYWRVEYEQESLDRPGFSGGITNYSNWLGRDDLYKVFDKAGFEIVGLSEFDHRSGPVAQFGARRRRKL